LGEPLLEQGSISVGQGPDKRLAGIERRSPQRFLAERLHLRLGAREKGK
jgi:hypothetical protein